MYERAISLGALSKTHGLAGLRLGWIATKSANVLRRMSTFKDYLTISNSAASENNLSAIAVRHTDTLIARNTNILRANLRLPTTSSRATRIASSGIGRARARSASCG